MAEFAVQTIQTPVQSEDIRSRKAVLPDRRATIQSGKLLDARPVQRAARAGSEALANDSLRSNPPRPVLSANLAGADNSLPHVTQRNARATPLPTGRAVIQMAGGEAAEKVNTKAEFRQTTTNFLGFRGSDHELDTIDGYLDEYHEIMGAVPDKAASTQEKQNFSDLRLNKLDEIEQQLRGWLARKKSEPNNKYRQGVRDLLSQVVQARAAQTKSAKSDHLKTSMSSFEKSLSKLSPPGVPAWKRKATAKSSRAKKRQQLAVEKEERKKRILGTLLAGMMLSASAIDTYNKIQQGPRTAPKKEKDNTAGTKKESQQKQLQLPSPSHNSTASQGLSGQTGHGLAINSTGTIDLFNSYPMSMATTEPLQSTSGMYFSEIPALEKTIHEHAQNKSLSNPDRLNTDIQQSLLFGAATARVNSEHGQKPLLGALHINNTLSALEGMGDKDHQQFMGLYQQAGHLGTEKELDEHSVATQQALLLKALGARKALLTSGDKDQKTGAMQELAEFAQSIRGTPRDSLIKQITPYDADERHSDSSFAPSTIEHMGTDGQLVHDRFTENDGLFQHLTMSCSSTSFMLARAEVDPAYALKLQNESFNRAEQNRLLKLAGTGASAREDMQNYKLLEKIVLAKDSHTPHAPGHELLAYANSTVSHLSTSGLGELQAIRKDNHGWPNDRQLDQMRSHNMTLGQSGTNVDLHAGIVDSEVGHYSGHKYERVSSAPKAKGDMVAELDELLATNKITKRERLERIRGLDKIIDSHQPNLILRVIHAVKQGHVVPINIPSHTMSVVDVKQDKKSYSFLIHDPWSGKSLWFKESELFKGNKVATAFGMPAQGDRFINDFILPK